MTMWGEGDLAVAVCDKDCGCGSGSIKHRTLYKIAEVITPPWGGPDDLFLNPHTKEDAHFFHHSNFRKETPTGADIFKLAEAPKPVKEKVHEPS